MGESEYLQPRLGVIDREKVAATTDQTIREQAAEDSTTQSLSDAIAGQKLRRRTQR